MQAELSATVSCHPFISVWHPRKSQLDEQCKYIRDSLQNPSEGQCDPDTRKNNADQDREDAVYHAIDLVILDSRFPLIDMFLSLGRGYTLVISRIVIAVDMSLLLAVLCFLLNGLTTNLSVSFLLSDRSILWRITRVR